MSLAPHLAASLGKKKKKKGFIDLDRGKRKALSAATQRNTLRDQNPKGQLWLRATLCHGLPSVCAVPKPMDRCEDV